MDEIIDSAIKAAKQAPVLLIVLDLAIDYGNFGREVALQ